MHVLVVGGTGLISTGITRQLVDAGHEVTVYNRGETDAAIPDAVSTLRGDRTDFDRFEVRMRELDPAPDCVIDMVCFTEAEAESAVRAFRGRIDQYVFCSTIDVYHRPPPRNPVTEDAPRHPPVSDYAAGKAAAEDVFFEVDGEAFDVTVLRPWNTYGEGGTLVHTFGTGSYYVDRIREGAPIVVHGDGTSLWGPCHRDDVAAAFVGAVGNEDAYGEAYNVTSEETMTWNQYHCRVASALDAPEPELVHVPTDVLTAVAPERTRMLRDHFQYSTVFENEKAKRDLGFEYTVDFETGVRRTVEWLDERDAVDSLETEPFEDELVAAWREATGEFVAANRIADD
ncbi:NAD-dependent epimerase/dehydratase family protein [Halopelagius longus]|uniref:NAD-dependent epimerase/dehydratase family protein n=1 Tax=Halopelagius longus TaxID=1236180 RepID=A0A1H0Y4X5_9EURY|nr:NAD-dependent epimerase/dehydratase family protein [Halopelagius longus]RDI72278.1 NAD-dependent epimerase/dehydratase family protein [Halopelagius longus]SDQ10208.1 Nucleoside-diphosphate-sugar epimerase [Halopelagius longus]